MTETPEKALERLLHELFDADEFCVFLRGLEEGERLVRALAGKGTSDETLFSDAVAALKRRGVIDEGFFVALIEERPRKATPIRRVAAAWVEESPLTAEPRGVHERGASHRESVGVQPEPAAPPEPRDLRNESIETGVRLTRPGGTVLVTAKHWGNGFLDLTIDGHQVPFSEFSQPELDQIAAQVKWAPHGDGKLLPILERPRSSLDESGSPLPSKRDEHSLKAGNEGGPDTGKASELVKVFLSYSYDNDAHRQAVLDLANRLRADGIDAWIDRYEPNPPQGWPRWMQDQVEKARYILLVCTETYRRRFDGKEEAGKGKGATWEGLLATQVLYDAGTRNEKLIPVLLDGGGEDHIPLAVRAYTHYRLPAGYNALYRHLTGQPEVVAPPLGQVRPMPPVTRGPALAPQPVVSAGLPATPPAVVQQGGQHIDNRGAQIGQVINVQGGATFTFGSIPEVPKKR